MDKPTEKPAKDLPVKDTDQIKGGRMRTEDPDAGGEVFKKKG
ncbi:MAG TPA: hypothetical protein VG817_01705 [Gemmatimonadales bacterium]|nr:hypothetical protein [Gemmatimonadales bacterium]